MPRTPVLVATLAAVAFLGAGCSVDKSASTGSDHAAKPGGARLRLHVLSPRSGLKTYRGHVRIRGRVSRGARVMVNGVRSIVASRRFSALVPLSSGRNRIRVVGRRAGRRIRRVLTVTRRIKLVATATPTPTPTPTPTATPSSAATPERSCDPNYAGACLKPDSPDYDCAGGSGDGPDYTGEVRVVGDDHYDLDRDGDGIGCEPY